MLVEASVEHAPIGIILSRAIDSRVVCRYLAPLQLSSAFCAGNKYSVLSSVLTDAFARVRTRSIAYDREGRSQKSSIA